MLALRRVSRPAGPADAGAACGPRAGPRASTCHRCVASLADAVRKVADSPPPLPHTHSPLPSLPLSDLNNVGSKSSSSID
jgi:hypothetical protein